MAMGFSISRFAESGDLDFGLALRRIKPRHGLL